MLKWNIPYFLSPIWTVYISGDLLSFIDIAQSRINWAPNENRTHSGRFESTTLLTIKPPEVTGLTILVTIYIYNELGIIPGLPSGISCEPHYSLSVLLYLSCNKTFLLSSMNVLTVSSIRIKLCLIVSLLRTTIDSILTRSKKYPNIVVRTKAVIMDWTDSR